MIGRGKVDATLQLCSECGLTWAGVHQCVPELKDRIAELERENRALRVLVIDERGPYTEDELQSLLTSVLRDTDK
jgi:hypothetical protein